MKKNVIVYGKQEGIQLQAVRHLSQILLDANLEYPVCCRWDRLKEEAGCRYLYIGTAQDNPYVSKLSDRVLSQPEEYYIKVEDDTVLIQGYDDGGVLYGCIDFYQKYVMKYCQNHNHDHYFSNIFEEKLPDFATTSAPALTQRGLWTWGHVIYDYQGYIDNMVRTKMNTLIIWNDFVPVNAKEMIAYAHASNVKIYWGYPWGWDTRKVHIAPQHLEAYKKDILEHYEANYADLGGDGIYFQSFTETKEEMLDGFVIAEVVTSFVNDTARQLYEKHPELELLFGLHATSVKEKLEYLAKVDPRIRIVWEDCGAFPWAYIPSKIDNFDKACELTEEILALRGEKERFGAVLKGFTCLDWMSFEHQRGSFYIGTASDKLLADRMERKSRIWHFVQAYWLRNADKASEMIRLIQEQNNGDALVTALVEDAMFEKKLYFPVALFGAMLWEKEYDLKDLICDVAQSSFVEFA